MAVFDSVNNCMCNALAACVLYPCTNCDKDAIPHVYTDDGGSLYGASTEKPSTCSAEKSEIVTSAYTETTPLLLPAHVRNIVDAKPTADAPRPGTLAAAAAAFVRVLSQPAPLAHDGAPIDIFAPDPRSLTYETYVASLRHMGARMRLRAELSAQLRAALEPPSSPEPGQDTTFVAGGELYTRSSWGEAVAVAVLKALEVVLEKGHDALAPDGVLMQANNKAQEVADEVFHFAKEHPIVTGIIVTVVTLGVLALLSEWVLVWLGFEELGIVEGESQVWRRERISCESLLILGVRG